MPKVSVILTSFNHEKYLRESIDSVLSQSFTDYELIIWDDASTDNSWAIIGEYKDERIVTFRNEKRMRGIWGINKSITEIAKGEYIAIHHSDDAWVPEKLKRQVEFMETHPNIGAAFTYVQTIDEDGIDFTIDDHFYSKIFDQPNRSRHEWLRFFFINGNALCHPSVLIRKHCYSESGLYRNGFGQVGDFDMWIRLCLRFDIHILQERLTKFRVRDAEGNTSGDRLEPRVRGFYEYYRLLSNYLEISDIYELSKVFPEASKYHGKGRPNVKYVLARLALELKPFNFTTLFGLNILFDLIQDKTIAEQILYNHEFDCNEFIKLTGEHDPFYIASIIRRNGEITIPKFSRTEREGQIAGLVETVIKCDEKIVALDRDVEEKDIQIARLNEKLAERDERIVITNEELKTLRDSLYKAHDKINAINDSLHQANEQINAIKNTSSWRMTAWIRWLKSRVRLLNAKRAISSLSTSKMTRFILRKLPISQKVRYAIKEAAFTHASPLFQNLPAYKAWNEFKEIEEGESGRSDSFSADDAIIYYVNDSRTYGIHDKKNMLVIDATTPTPDRDAGSVTAYYFMKAFVELGYSVTFIPDDLKPLGHYTNNLRALGVRCLTRRNINSIQEFLIHEGRSFDVIFLYRVHTARLHMPAVKKYAPKAKIIFDTVDMHHLREERQAALNGSSEAKERARYTKNAEYKVMRESDVTIVLSDAEMDNVRDNDSSINVFKIPLLLNIPGRGAPYSRRRDIIFIGGFLHQPNVDSIEYFAKEIWPIVRDKLVDAKLVVIGSNPPDDVCALGKSDARIDIVGFVEDIEPYFDNSRVSIAPLRFGAGIKGKIGTSASYGVPCVATTLAIEGMGLIDGVNVLVADDREKFADKIVCLYSDEQLWNKISENSFEFVQRNYSYNVGKARIRRLLNSLYNGFNANEIIDVVEIESLEEYRNYQQWRKEENAGRFLIEHEAFSEPCEYKVKGYCAVCRKASSFYYDLEYALTDMHANLSPNWRERLVCENCGLNNRARAAMHLFKQECAPPHDAEIYLTEQNTDLYSWMKRNYASVVGSEYLGSEHSPGENNSDGIRHESLTNLSINDESIDYILSFDVLEHIPNYRSAIHECARVLRPGGQMLFSVPFCIDSNDHIVRARMSDEGEIEHILKPEYHGDPMNNSGCLCFYHFGWHLLDEFRDAGFDHVKALVYWSERFCYFGIEQITFIAIKQKNISKS